MNEPDRADDRTHEQPPVANWFLTKDNKALESMDEGHVYVCIYVCPYDCVYVCVYNTYIAILYCS